MGRRRGLRFFRMTVRRNLGEEQRDLRLPGALPERSPGQSRSGPRVKRSPALKVGKREGGPPITPIGHSEDGKKCRVLRDRQELSVAESPATDREVEWEYPNLA